MHSTESLDRIESTEPLRPIGPSCRVRPRNTMRR
jgi:hypothetical protein